MSLPYKVYKIQPKETLEMLADNLRLNPDELRAFHNRHCELEALLGAGKIPRHIKEIYIPKVLGSSRPTPNGQRLQSNRLSRSPKKVNRTYGVIHKIFENETQKSQLHYKIKIGNEVGEDLPYNRLYVRKHQSFLNEHSLETNAEQLYEKLDQLLYPLQLNLRGDGSIASIANKKEIAERWFKTERAKFIQYYSGDFSEKIIHKLDDFFKNMESYQAQIDNSLFYTLFFMPLYIDYGEKEEYHYKKGIPLFPFKEKVEYHIRQKLDTVLSPTSKIFVRLEGECSDLRTPADIAAGNIGLGYKDDNKDKGKLDLTYKLNAEDNSLFSLWGEISLDLSPDTTRKVEIEIYELINVK